MIQSIPDLAYTLFSLFFYLFDSFLSLDVRKVPSHKGVAMAGQQFIKKKQKLIIIIVKWQNLHSHIYMQFLKNEGVHLYP